MALIDSSVWIDYLTERPVPHAEILAARLDQGLPVATTGIVMQELLQGVKTERDAHLLRARLSRLRYLPAGKSTHGTAASLYRKVRARGITLPAVDALIAAIAVENGVPLLTADAAHFEALARVSKLRLLRE
jgi:predicted nucleic acid-binding protein